MNFTQPTNYAMEELLPIIARLSYKYTSGDSTSITYAQAQKLMASVLYCIQAGETAAANSLLPTETKRRPAADAYEHGLALITKKVQQALHLYQQILQNFNDYDNYFLHSTIIDGMPEFFKWYDVNFAAHEDILTLDYPVLQDLTSLCGINKIYRYLQCIEQEQKFLAQMPPAFIRQTLAEYNPFYRDTPDNLVEIICQQLNLPQPAACFSEP